MFSKLLPAAFFSRFRELGILQWPDKSPSTQVRRDLRKVRPEMSWEILVARPSAGLPEDPGVRALRAATPPGSSIGAAA